MELFLKADIDIFSFIICFCMFVVNYRMGERHHLQNRLFRALTLSTMVLLLLEGTYAVLSGLPSPAVPILLTILGVSAYSLLPVPSMLWALYASFQLYRDIRRLKTEGGLLLIPFALGALLSFFSALNGLVFGVSGGNTYIHGPLFPAILAIMMLPLVYTAALYISQRKRTEAGALMPMVLCSAIPMAGAALQFVYADRSIYCVSMAVAIFAVHSSTQNRQFHLDHLTGLYNRRQLDSHIFDCMQAARKNGAFSCILLDVDDFKDINDSCGHIAGDQALKEAAQILKSSVRASDFVARYAGDEFVIVLNITEESILKKTIDRIQDHVAQFNRNNTRPYTLGFSVGYNIYRHGAGVSRDEFIAAMDAMMYRDKNRKKAVAAKEKCRLAIARIKRGSYLTKTKTCRRM